MMLCNVRATTFERLHTVCRVILFQEYVRSQANDSLTQHYVIERQMARLFNQVINKGNKLWYSFEKKI